MNEGGTKTWITMGIIFAVIVGVWVYAKKPGLIPGLSPGAKYINFETVAQSVQSGVVRIGSLTYGAVVGRRGYVLTAVTPGFSIDPTVAADGRPVGLSPGGTNIHFTTSSGEAVSGEIVRIDTESGLALLKIMSDIEFETVKIARPAAVKSADPFLVVINGSSIAVNASSRGRPGGGLILTDLDTQLPVDGLPLFNALGKVVGICVRRLEGKRWTIFAIPISWAAPLLKTITKLEPVIVHIPKGVARIDWMGARLLPRNEISGTSFLIEKIGHLHSAGTAWHAGAFKVGDKIVRINGRNIVGLAGLESAVPLLAQGKRVNLAVVRGGRVQDLVLTARPGSWLPGPRFVPIVLVLAFYFLTYFFVYRGWLNRTILFFVAAVSLTVCGYYLDFYSWSEAWDALSTKVDVICFIIGMNILTIILDEGGLFGHLAGKIILVTRGGKWKILLSFCLLTYVFSLFVNNLTTIMVLLPMLFRLSRYLRFDPKPFMIAMIIASNLGGASTMVGDFPNMLIGTETGIAFTSFASYMMPVCLIELALLLVYIRFSQRGLFACRKKKNEVDVCEELPQLAHLTEGVIITRDETRNVFDRIERDLEQGMKNPIAVKRGLAILSVLVVGFLVSDYIGIPPAILALGAGIAGVFFGKTDREVILDRICYKDILFFSSLFVLVGAAEASGLLDLLGQMIVRMSFGSPLVQCLVLMWVTGIVTALLNAGPSAALFLDIVMKFKVFCPHYLYFWSLSLGVLAGSSATITGATAGSVGANMLDEFLATNKPGGRGASAGQEPVSVTPLSFREYSRVGVPIAIAFLIVSSFYVIMLYCW